MIPFKGEVFTTSLSSRVPSLRGPFKTRRASLYSVKRPTRRQALQTIFTELKATTFRQRRAVIRQLYRPIASYASMAEYNVTTLKQQNEWLHEVQTCAGKLADLLSDRRTSVSVYSTLDYLDRAQECEALGWLLGEEREVLIEMLEDLHNCTGVRFRASRGRSESPRKSANYGLVIELARIYQAATGREAGAGRVSGNAKTRQGKPTGPFFRLVQAVHALIGDGQSDEAIFSTIRDYKSW
jgi:hypothetical protein